jgi:predicted MFS family arabinose efflux permease
MPQSLRLVLGNPQIRLLSLMLFLMGSTSGATSPYMSITAIRTLGMSNSSFSLLMLVTSVTATLISVSIGIFSDQATDRRRIVAMVSAMGVAGYGAIFLWPSIPVFVIVSTLVLPVSGSVGSLVFSLLRSETSALTQRDAAAVNATTRAFLSAAWVVMPAAMGFALATQPSMIGAWGAAAVCSGAILLMALTILKKSAAAPMPSKSGFFRTLGELARPLILLRVLLMAMLTGVIRLSGTIWPLIVTLELHGRNTDVGMITGLIALLEIPFMLIWAAALRKLSIMTIIAWGGVIYAFYLAALSLAAALWQVYALVIPGALGAAALLTMPLSYFQNLFPDKPGFGTSFDPIIFFVGNGVTAASFAIGTHYFGYSGTAWIGVGLALAGLSGLLVIERKFGDEDPSLKA